MVFRYLNTEAEAVDEEGDREGYTPRGAQVELVHVGGGGCPPEENANLPGIKPERVHLLFQEVYGDFPRHNNG